MRLPDGPGLTNSLDIVSGQLRERDRDRYLSVLYAPAELRPALMALHGLDLELASVVAGTSEPMIGEIRLAWWREALAGLDGGTVPAQPLLEVLAAEALPLGLTGAALSALEDRWIGLIGSETVPATHIEGGGALFAMAARLGGGDETLARRIGEAWTAGDAVELPRVPVPLRPLLGLLRLAQRDAGNARAGRAPEPRGSVRRQLRLLAAIAFGR